MRFKTATASIDRASAHHGGHAGRHGDHAAIFQFIWAAPQSFGHRLAEQRLGHRAAAGVAGADEQNDYARQPLERLLRDDALAEHFKMVVVDSDDARRLTIP